MSLSPRPAVALRPLVLLLIAVAGGSLGAYLVHHGQLKPYETLSIMQGVEMGRPSEIQVEVSEERGKLTPQVSGSAVRIFEGHIEA